MYLSIMLIPLFFFIIITLTIILNKTNSKPIKTKLPDFSYINNYEIPDMVIKKFQQKYPKLNKEDTKLTILALKEFFKIHKFNNYKKIGMPSEVVDELWHSFILDSENYEIFCKKAFGRTLHHKIENENVTLKDLTKAKIHPDLLNTFKLSKKIKSPIQVLYGLPILFAIDMMLEIPNGYQYEIENLNSQLNSKEGSGGSGCSTSISGNSSDSSSSGCSSSSCSSSSGCGGGGD